LQQQFQLQLLLPMPSTCAIAIVITAITIKHMQLQSSAPRSCGYKHSHYHCSLHRSHHSLPRHHSHHHRVMPRSWRMVADTQGGGANWEGSANHGGNASVTGGASNLLAVVKIWRVWHHYHSRAVGEDDVWVMVEWRWNLFMVVQRRNLFTAAEPRCRTTTVEPCRGGAWSAVGKSRWCVDGWWGPEP
jgi:hypothetical protein